MKKYAVLLLAIIMVLTVFAGCKNTHPIEPSSDNSLSSSGQASSDSSQEEKSIYTSLAENIGSIEYFSDGIGKFTDKSTGKLGLVDTKGNILVNAEYVTIKLCISSGNYVLYTDEENRKDYVPGTGEIVESECAHGGISFCYWDASTGKAVMEDFGEVYDAPDEMKKTEEGLYPIRGLDIAKRTGSLGETIEYRKFGYTDEDLNLVIPLEYVYACDFVDGLAAVCSLDANGNLVWGYINENNVPVIPFA